MGQWTKNGIDLLLLLYQLYEKLIFGASYLQMDETTLKVLEDGKGKCHLGYLWVAFDPVNKLPFFSYHPGRDHKKPKKLLERFAGILQCDGYAVYETVGKQRPDIRLVNCMAHIRREFFEAKSNDDKRDYSGAFYTVCILSSSEPSHPPGIGHSACCDCRVSFQVG